MTDDVIAAAQDLLNRGESRRQIIEKLGIRYDTLRKAINQGRLRELSQPPSQPSCDEPPLEGAGQPGSLATRKVEPAAMLVHGPHNSS